MVQRETNPDLINRLSNEPDVYAVLASRYSVKGPIDWSPAFPSTRTGCVILSNGEDAAQAYELRGERSWEVCTVFAKTCRGKRALETGLEMRKWMEPYADLIFGCIPDSLPNAKQFYARLGGQRVESVEVNGDILVPREGEEMFAWRTV